MNEYAEQKETCMKEKKSSNDLRDPAKGEELEKSILSDATMLSSAGANS